MVFIPKFFATFKLMPKSSINKIHLGSIYKIIYNKLKKNK